MIYRTFLICLCLGVGFSQPTIAETDEAIDARSFVHEKCSSCHDSSIYTRKDRRVDSLSRLNSQVRMCDTQLGTSLFDEDITAIVKYLNDSYYHFDK